ncbi:hypothetical protein, partial [Mesomycoplasma ovipneumoniae]|uniref:hypothetical protein n=1 Tax=Mesomycoplasma ovipneumoniae TaxID=29562 RepID=UPI00207A7169
MTNHEFEQAEKDKNNSDKPTKIEPDSKNRVLKRRIEFQNENKKTGVLPQNHSSESKDNTEIQKL